jgi:catechol 2,3-dioxygenase-like lactoylglutathione lyase family enzyme
VASDRVSAGEIHHLTVGVSDIERSLLFYGEGLGLRKTLDTHVSGGSFERLLRLPVGSTARTVFLQGSSRVGQIELVQWSTSIDDQSPVRRAGSLGYTVLSFSLTRETFPRVCSQLKSVGALFWNEPEKTMLRGYGEIEACIVEDPDGNMIELVRLPSDDEVREFRNQGDE